MLGAQLLNVEGSTEFQKGPGVRFFDHVSGNSLGDETFLHKYHQNLVKIFGGGAVVDALRRRQNETRRNDGAGAGKHGGQMFPDTTFTGEYLNKLFVWVSLSDVSWSYLNMVSKILPIDFFTFQNGGGQRNTKENDKY